MHADDRLVDQSAYIASSTIHRVVSIHVPNEGNDSKSVREHIGGDVSIHVPNEGNDGVNL